MPKSTIYNASQIQWKDTQSSDQPPMPNPPTYDGEIVSLNNRNMLVDSMGNEHYDVHIEFRYKLGKLREEYIANNDPDRVEKLKTVTFKVSYGTKAMSETGMVDLIFSGNYVIAPNPPFGGGGGY